MTKVVFLVVGLALAVLSFQGCAKNGSSSVPASQYYASVASAPSQGKPLSSCMTNPGSVPIVKCRLEDKDDNDRNIIRRKCEDRKHRGGKDHEDSDDFGIVICHVPPGNPSNSQTLCLSWEGVLGHFNHPFDYLGVCRPITPGPTPTPTPPPFGGNPSPTPPPFGGNPSPTPPPFGG